MAEVLNTMYRLIHEIQVVAFPARIVTSIAGLVGTPIVVRVLARTIFAVVTAGIATASMTLPSAQVAAQSCGSCSDTGDGRHIAIEEAGPGLDDGLGDGWHQEPITGSCLFIHGVCGGDDEGGMAFVGDATVAAPLQIVDEVVAAVLDEDVARLADFTSHPFIQITRKRMAIQVVGCGGTIVGHIPVRAELLASLTLAVALDEP